MAKGTGTSHYKLHSYVGWGTVLGLPFAIIYAVRAIHGGSDGFINWLSSPIGAIGFLAFFTAAVWYCKLEMDEVIMDYFSGGLRKFGLFKNKVGAFVIWAVAVYAVCKLAFLG